jgi:hypothetical protein
MLRKEQIGGVMAWFLNLYRCVPCGIDWADEWSAMCDDDCPRCGGDMSPHRSEDLSEIIVPRKGGFAIFFSSETAERRPDYRLAADGLTFEEAAEYIAAAHDAPKLWQP